MDMISIDVQKRATQAIEPTSLDLPIGKADGSKPLWMFHEAPPPTPEKTESWFLDHLVGLREGPKDDLATAKWQALKFMRTHARQDVKEIIASRESELVHRVWMERVQEPENNLDGYFVFATGLLIHEGEMPATPNLIGGYVDLEQGKDWYEAIENNAGNNNKKAYIEAKTRAERWLVEKLVEQEATFAGRKDQPVPHYMRLGPDTGLHIFVNGWTGNHLEFIEHFRALLRGIGRYSDGDKFVEKIKRDIDAIAIQKGMTLPLYELDKLIGLIREHPGQLDPRNHVFVGFGNQGAAGTMPSEFDSVSHGYEVPKSVNDKVTTQDIIDQPVYALEELANQLATLQQSVGMTDINPDQARRNVLRNFAHGWGHSMGGRVLLGQLDQNSRLWQLMQSVGNDYFKIHAWNAVTYGDKVFNDPAEAERVRKQFHSDTLPIATTFINKDTLLGLVVRHGARILTPRLMHKLNLRMGVTRRMTEYLLGSTTAAVPYAVHQDTTINGREQYSHNTRWCAEFGYFINEGDFHRRNLQQMVSNGRLDIWIGTEDPGDRILLPESIDLQGQALQNESYFETHDHAIDPIQLQWIAPFVFSYMRGDWSPPVHPRQMLAGLLSDVEVKAWTKLRQPKRRRNKIVTDTLDLDLEE